MHSGRLDSDMTPSNLVCEFASRKTTIGPTCRTSCSLEIRTSDLGSEGEVDVQTSTEVSGTGVVGSQSSVHRRKQLKPHRSEDQIVIDGDGDDYDDHCLYVRKQIPVFVHP
ncbi:hypothetical protein AHF37_02436 [Paragonimus kellicotti]|nr:hypothetical protein AHF37_02436 [Paragonimus kellicotti]